VGALQRNFSLFTSGAGYAYAAKGPVDGIFYGIKRICKRKTAVSLRTLRFVVWWS
jgi:hypothetical protein